MLRFLLLFSAWLLATGLSAQVNNFLAASYRGLENQTHRGYISEEGDPILSRYIQFRATEGGKIDTIPASQIIEVQFTESGRQYRQVTHSYTDERKQTLEVIRLGELLVEGDYPLVKLPLKSGEYRDITVESKRYVYYLLFEGKWQKLEVEERGYRRAEKRVPEEGENIKYVFDLKRYQGVLRSLFRDWPEAEARTKELPFTDRSLMRIVRDYSLFRNPDSKVKFTKKRLLRIAPHLRVVNYFQPTLPDRDQVDYGFGGSLMIAFFSPRISNNLEVSIGYDVSYFRYDIADTQERLVSGLISRVPIYADYYFSRNSKFQPFARFSFGVGVTEITSERASTFLPVFGPNGEITFVRDNYEKLPAKRDFISSLGIGAGFRYGAFGLDVTYAQNVGLGLGLSYLPFKR